MLKIMSVFNFCQSYVHNKQGASKKAIFKNNKQLTIFL